MTSNLKKLRLCTIIAALPALAFIPQAHAENGAGLTLGLDYGQAEATKFCDNIANCDNADNSMKAEIGFQFTRGFGLELGYTSLGTLLDARDSQFRATQESSARTLSAVGLMSFNDAFGIYGRLGAASYTTDSAGTVASVPVRDQDGVTPFYGVGVKLGITDNFSLRAEYQVYSDISRVDGREDDVHAMYAGIHILI